MPNYWNPNNFYPTTYGNNMGYPMGQTAMPMQQSYAQAPMTNQPKAMEWVEGEVGAKAFQMPAGWPANTPIPLWDSTETVIWLKSWGQMGIPNPMQKLEYKMPETQNQALLQSGATGGQSGHGNMENYVTKEDLAAQMTEIKEMLKGQMSGTNQNGSNGQNGNRGGQR